MEKGSNLANYPLLWLCLLGSRESGGWHLPPSPCQPLPVCRKPSQKENLPQIWRDEICLKGYCGMRRVRNLN